MRLVLLHAKLAGYMRVLLNCIAFSVCFSNKTLFSLLYFFR